MELEEIPVPGHATAKSLRGYSAEYRKHPGRNRPEAVAWLIERYTKVGDRVLDPMAGAGTMLFEAQKLGRLRKTAWGQLREKANPGAPWIDTEYALVFRK